MVFSGRGRKGSCYSMQFYINVYLEMYVKSSGCQRQTVYNNVLLHGDTASRRKSLEENLCFFRGRPLTGEDGDGEKAQKGQVKF